LDESRTVIAAEEDVDVRLLRKGRQHLCSRRQRSYVE
jgi:hypothetical protein